MTSPIFQRRPLTALLLAQLATVQVDGHNVLVGDGSMPAGSGWGLSSPNQPGAVFVPYLVLTPMTVAPAADQGSFAEPQADWHVPYLIQSFGARSNQAEWMADEARKGLLPLKGTIVSAGPNYKIAQVWFGGPGGVNRVPESDPPFWGEQDQFTLWLMKRRN